jgi:phosphoribosylformimino-5-aminoimidazole carboxamide ribotide isomerase
MALTLYPAIDLKDGRCVRLKRGVMEDATIYGDEPAAQARLFESVGFKALHVVDLDGAFAGRPVNATAARAILAACHIPVQLGGGIRDMVSISSWLELGVSRIILGSVAVKNPALVRQAAKTFPGQIIVGIDARDGMVATEGWSQTSTLTATEIAKHLEDSGITAIIYTDIARDGMLSGLNLEATEALAATVAINVIASGGVAGVEDIVRLREASARHSNLVGAVVGRAFYDGSLVPKIALAAATC